VPRPPFPKTLRRFQLQFTNEEACHQSPGHVPLARGLQVSAMYPHSRLHKLRRAMVNVAREPLRGEVEIDDTWVGGIQAGLRGSRQLKGRRAALVLVAEEKRGQTSGRIRMAVIVW